MYIHVYSNNFWLNPNKHFSIIINKQNNEIKDGIMNGTYRFYDLKPYYQIINLQLFISIKNIAALQRVDLQ